MSRLGFAELAALVEEFNAGTKVGNGRDWSTLEEWCKARDVDPVAMASFGAQQAQLALEVFAGQEVGLGDAIAGAAICGFQLGLEIEARRGGESLDRLALHAERVWDSSRENCAGSPQRSGGGSYFPVDHPTNPSGRATLLERLTRALRAPFSKAGGK